MIRAVIFDMDGLIIETESLQSKAYEQVVREHGKEPQYESNGLVHVVGVRGDLAWKTILDKHNITGNIEALRTRRREIYIRLLQGHLVPTEGLSSLLELLRQKHIKIALATGSSQKIAIFILKGLGILRYFSVLVTGDQVKNGKPDPECFIRAAEKIHEIPENCLVLEDAEPGIRAAKQIGMHVIAVPTVYTQDQDFAQADFVVKSLADVTQEMINSF